MKRIGTLFALVSALGLVLAVSAFAGGKAEEEPGVRPTVDATGPQVVPMHTDLTIPRTFSESPILAARVRAGELPPVEQRLPPRPAVVRVVDEIGRYGGNLRVASPNETRLGDGFLSVTFATLLKPDYDGETYIGHVAEDFWYEDGGRTIVYRIREGLKWSDGAPLVVDDFRLARGIGEWYWRYHGENATIDWERLERDWEFALSWSTPRPLFHIEEQHQWSDQGGNAWYLPSHYLKQYHGDYADPQELAALLRQYGYTDWEQLYELKRFGPTQNPIAPERVGIPTLASYKIVEVTPTTARLERNPYYWRVDEAGNQLPYIDTVTVRLVGSELYSGVISSGQVDFAARRTLLQDLPLYQQGAADHDFRVLLWPSPATGSFGLQLNFNHRDPVLRDLIQDLDFRRALSIAVNREEFSTIVTQGLAQATHTPMRADGQWVDEEIVAMNSQYDPDAANALLDSIGLRWDANRRWRLRPDGSRLRLTVINHQVERVLPLELIQEYWAAVGVELLVRTVDGSLHGELRSALDYDLTISDYGRTELGFMVEPYWMIPLHRHWQMWAGAWTDWFNDPSLPLAEEPPQMIKDLWATWEALLVETDEARRLELGRKLVRSHAENVWVIGLTTWGATPIIVSERLRNVIEDGLWAWAQTYYTDYARVDQWYFAD